MALAESKERNGMAFRFPRRFRATSLKGPLSLYIQKVSTRLVDLLNSSGTFGTIIKDAFARVAGNGSSNLVAGVTLGIRLLLGRN